MLQILGAFLIIAGSTGVGYMFKKELQQRLFHLTYIKKLIGQIQDEMLYHKSTMPEICESLNKNVIAPYQDLFLRIHKKLLDHSGKSLEDVWKEEIEEIENQIPIHKTDILLVKEIFKGTFSSGQLQQRELQYYIQKLDDIIKKLEQEIHNKSKVYLCLGVTGGILCTIILI